MNTQYNDPIEVEVWRAVPGYEGLYEVSIDGRVRSLPRNTTSGRILSRVLNRNGYLRVSLTKDGHGKYVYVHKLVAEAFHGLRPEGMDINHIDGNKQNNHVSNLEFATRAENMKHAREHGLHKNFADGHYGAKLTREMVEDIRYAFNTCGLRGKDLAEALGVSARTIDDVLDGKTWRSVDE